ncbi:MAG: hypothetical protein Q8N38_09505 [Bacteroidales bacterium]|nr:hypothetical protein [Bacteroidales bacterium]
MKGKHGIRSDNLTKKEVSVINRDVVVFAFFLLLSFIFWYLNSLGKVIEAGIRYPVKYINLPKERVIVEEIPVRLNLYFKGPGYSVLKLKLSGNRTPVLIDISKVNYKRVHDSKALNYFIITSGLTKSLSVQLRSGCEITSIKPDTLFFTLDKTAAKSVPVNPENNVVKNRK